MIKSPILSALSPIDRLTLLTDGTLTQLFSAWALEPIELVLIAQNVAPACEPVAVLALAASDSLMDRTILLRGVRSGVVYLHAQSQIALDRLDRAFAEELVAAKLPIGELWIKLRVETFKEMIETGRREAGPLASLLRVAEKAEVLFRRYRVWSARKPIMVITESFPEEWASAETVPMGEYLS